jgi:hypothetical protein
MYAASHSCPGGRDAEEVALPLRGSESGSVSWGDLALSGCTRYRAAPACFGTARAPGYRRSAVALAASNSTSGAPALNRPQYFGGVIAPRCSGAGSVSARASRYSWLDEGRDFSGGFQHSQKPLRCGEASGT